MTKDKIFISIVGLIVLLGAAYAASYYKDSHKVPVSTVPDASNNQASVVSDDSIKATFNEPANWTKQTGSNYITFSSPDLRYTCDGKLYTAAEAAALWDNGNGPCFRSPIGKGSQIWIVNQGDMGMANYTLDNIPENWTDGNQANTIKNLEKIKVDGYDAVQWEDEYGDSPGSNLTVAIIKGHELYMIKQAWGPKTSNPYPNLVQSIVDSFKFSV